MRLNISKISHNPNRCIVEVVTLVAEKIGNWAIDIGKIGVLVIGILG